MHEQSVDIAQGVDSSGNKDEGAGDQGIMFGYACTETEPLMPAPIHYSHRILQDMAKARHSGRPLSSVLIPKARSRFNMRMASPVRATSVVVSTQHSEDAEPERVREIVRGFVENRCLPDGWMCPEEEFYVNPTGRFVIGGPDGDLPG